MILDDVLDDEGIEQAKEYLSNPKWLKMLQDSRKLHDEAMLLIEEINALQSMEATVLSMRTQLVRIAWMMNSLAILWDSAEPDSTQDAITQLDPSAQYRKDALERRIALRHELQESVSLAQKVLQNARDLIGANPGNS